MGKHIRNSGLLILAASVMLWGCGGGREQVRPQPGSPSLGKAPAELTSTQKKKANEVSVYAKKFLGKEYRYGGNSAESGFDCSGFTQRVYGHFGISLGRQADGQFNQGQIVDPAKLRRGDLVFFTTYKPGPSHVGIYLSQGQFIHSPSTGKKIRIDKLSNSYWKPRFLGARRVLP